MFGIALGCQPSLYQKFNINDKSLKSYLEITSSYSQVSLTLHRNEVRLDELHEIPTEFFRIKPQLSSKKISNELILLVAAYF